MDPTQPSRNPLVLLVLLMVCLSIIGCVLAAGATYTSEAQPAQNQYMIKSPFQPTQKVLQPPLNEEEPEDEEQEEEQGEEIPGEEVQEEEPMEESPIEEEPIEEE